MYDSSLRPVVCRRDHVLFTLFVFLHVVVSNTYCLFVCLRIVFPMLQVSLDCPFFIAPSAFSIVYIQAFYKHKYEIFKWIWNVPISKLCKLATYHKQNHVYWSVFISDITILATETSHITNGGYTAEYTSPEPKQSSTTLITESNDIDTQTSPYIDITTETTPTLDTSPLTVISYSETFSSTTVYSTQEDTTDSNGDLSRCVVFLYEQSFNMWSKL